MQSSAGAAGRRRRRFGRLSAAVAMVLAVLSAQPVGAGTGGVAADDGVVRLNHVQVIGTHNSYHVEPPAEAIEFYATLIPEAIELAYSHPPLAEQFSFEGVRQIELDVFYDPTGTLFRPFGVPGYKVLHIEVIDEGSTCELFVACLAELEAWSRARPAHMPIAVLVEIKDTQSFPVGPLPVPVGPAELDVLDDEIRSIFPEDRLITPDLVRDGRPTLEAAVLEGAWPAIDDVRGDVIFLLDNKRDAYRAGRPSLEGRVAFTPSTPGQPDAAFVKVNDPLGANTAWISQLVTDGYVVRTRADTPVRTVLDGDVSQRDAALASGGQWVSTDYPVPERAARWGSTYVAQIPGGNPARCNPINAPVGCTAAMIEDLPPEQRPVPSPPPTGPAPAAATAGAVAPAFTG